MRFRLIPREEQFFDLIERAAQYALEASDRLEDLVRRYEKASEKVAVIDGLEHACDEVCHTTLQKLETTFITPFDREDIHELIMHIDDVTDFITASASRLLMFRVTQIRPPVLELAAVIRRQTAALCSAVGKLRHPKQFSGALNDCVEIHRLENEADDIMRRCIGELFESEPNAIEVIKWKEIYQTFETVTDCGEDAANIIQAIVVKNA